MFLLQLSCVVHHIQIGAAKGRRVLTATPSPLLACRVPLIDAQQYARALQARKDAPEVKIWVFSEDTHALDKPQTDFEQWMNVACWLRRHMQ